MVYRLSELTFMANGLTSTSSLPWIWAVEALASSNQVDASLLIGIVCESSFSIVVETAILHYILNHILWLSTKIMSSKFETLSLFTFHIFVLYRIILGSCKGVCFIGGIPC